MDEIDDEPRRPITAVIAAWIWIVHGVVGIFGVACLLLTAVYFILIQDQRAGDCFCTALFLIFVGVIICGIIKRGTMYLRGKIREPRIDATISLCISPIFGLLLIPIIYELVHELISFRARNNFIASHLIAMIIISTNTGTIAIAGIFAIISRKAYFRWVNSRSQSDTDLKPPHP